MSIFFESGLWDRRSWIVSLVEKAIVKKLTSPIASPEQIIESSRSFSESERPRSSLMGSVSSASLRTPSADSTSAVPALGSAVGVMRKASPKVRGHVRERVHGFLEFKSSRHGKRLEAEPRNSELRV